MHHLSVTVFSVPLSWSLFCRVTNISAFPEPAGFPRIWILRPKAGKPGQLGHSTSFIFFSLSVSLSFSPHLSQVLLILLMPPYSANAQMSVLHTASGLCVACDDQSGRWYLEGAS